MSDETIENERNLSAEETVEMEKTESAAAVSAEAPKKAKKKGKFGTAFSDLIHNFGKGGWVLFVTMILTFLVMVGTCLAVFFYSVHGEEKVMVPNVLGKNLVNALFDMQVKELYPKISLRFSDLPGDEGTILEQQPAGGSIVKAYQTVDLVVSRGVEIESMEDYVGKNIDEVQTRLKTLFSDDTTVEFAPVIYQKDSSSSAGTILAQYPEPGTYLSHVRVYFIVSTSNTSVTTIVPNIQGMSIQQVLAEMEKYPVVFNFSAVQSDSKDIQPTISSQEKAGASVDEFTTVNAQITLPAPDPESMTEYGLFKYTLPEYPFPVNVRLESSDSEGAVTKLVDFLHPGKEITIPYMVKKNSVLTLSVNGETITSQIIQ